jgi:hypothetical protein
LLSRQPELELSWFDAVEGADAAFGVEEPMRFLLDVSSEGHHDEFRRVRLSICDVAETDEKWRAS